MKVIGRVLVGLSVLSMLISCSPSWEGKGDSAYNMAKRVGGDEKRIQLKTAYIMYQKAVKKNPNRVSPKLRDRFLEMSLMRANMVINEGAAHMDAIPLFMNDIEKYLTADAPSELRQQYALFLTQLADSSAAKDKFDQAIAQADKALQFATDQGPITERKRALTERITKDNFEVAKIEYEEGKANKDAEALIKAEFHVLITLLYDPNNAEAAELLSKLRRENKGTYSAYLKVIEHIPDSAIFRKINKYDILLAAPVISGGGTSMTVHIYNYSWNPLRLKTENFFLVDKEGKRYQARPGQLDPEILDQEHEAKLRLNFPNPGEIAKLIYENGDHYSEKAFM